MNDFSFEPERQPFPRWLGPFSPARGTRTGFRFRGRQIGTWVADSYGSEFWPIRYSAGTRRLSDLVRAVWGGGRVLMLPNGYVVKPLQADEEVGQRVFIGRFRGPVILESPYVGSFDLSGPPGITPGDPWEGPNTVGLECVIRQNGSLNCAWYHPTDWGRDVESAQIREPDSELWRGFRRARPGDTGGRVRITANGTVITNHQEDDGSWISYYIGQIAPSSWGDWSGWIRRE